MRLEFFFIPIRKKYVKISLITHNNGEFYEAFGFFDGKRKYKRTNEKQEAVNCLYRHFKNYE